MKNNAEKLYRDIITQLAVCPASVTKEKAVEWAEYCTDAYEKRFKNTFTVVSIKKEE